MTLFCTKIHLAVCPVVSNFITSRLHLPAGKANDIPVPLLLYLSDSLLPFIPIICLKSRGNYWFGLSSGGSWDITRTCTSEFPEFMFKSLIRNLLWDVRWRKTSRWNLCTSANQFNDVHKVLNAHWARVGNTAQVLPLGKVACAHQWDVHRPDDNDDDEVSVNI